MKASEAQVRAALGAPGPDVRFYLLYGADEAGAHALQKRLEAALGPEAERVDLEPATLRSDPARLADEAAALSLFGTKRHIRVTGIGDESLAAVEGLLAADRAGNPVVAIGPNLKATSKLVKLALADRAAMACACFPPNPRDAARIAGEIGATVGLRLTGSTAQRIADAAQLDRAIMAQELAKLALYLDAAPDRPRELDGAALDAVGAALDDGEIGAAVEAVVGGDPAALADALAPLDAAGTSPIPFLRALVRRLQSLADMRAELQGGGDVDALMKRHRVFWREEAATKAALARWSPKMLAEAHARVRAAERAVMAAGAAGGAVAGEVVGTIARGVARR